MANANDARNAFAGGLAGIVSALLLQPLDVIKTRAQQRPDLSLSQHDRAMSRNGLSRPTSARLFSGIIQQEGVSALWSGSFASTLRVALGAGLYFTLLARFQEVAEHFGRDTKEKKTNMVLGATARFVAAIIENPIAVVKSRLESSHHTTYKGTADALQRLVTVEKAHGVFRGLSWTLLRDVPYSALYLTCYRELQPVTLKYISGSTSLSNFSAGLVAGALCTALTHPFDVVKTRVQLVMPKEGGGVVETSVSSRQVVKDIMQEGIHTWLSGIWPRVWKRALTSALIWTTYEKVVEILEPEKDSYDD